MAEMGSKLPVMSTLCHSEVLPSHGEADLSTVLNTAAV